VALLVDTGGKLAGPLEPPPPPPPHADSMVIAAADKTDKGKRFAGSRFIDLLGRLTCSKRLASAVVVVLASNYWIKK
jgi:hypothetical protein